VHSVSLVSCSCTCVDLKSDVTNAMVARPKDASATSTTRGKLAKFVPFTEQSLEKIADRIAADKVRQQTATDSEKRSRGTRRKEDARTVGDRRKDKPNTAFVAGKQFPEKFGIFPPELYGKPIEDLDEFYKNKYVSTFYLIFSDYNVSVTDIKAEVRHE